MHAVLGATGEGWRLAYSQQCNIRCCCFCRLEDDERLDKLLDQLEKKLPAPDSRHQQQAPAARPTGPKRAGSAEATAKAQSAGRGRRPGGSVAAAAAAGIGLRSRSAGWDQHAGAVAGAGDRSTAPYSDDIDHDESEYGSSSVTGDGSSTVSVKSGLAAELRMVRQQLEELENRAGNKARRALAGLPAAVNRSAGTR